MKSNDEISKLFDEEGITRMIRQLHIVSFDFVSCAAGLTSMGLLELAETLPSENESNWK